MYQHTVRNRKLSPLQGIGVVALLLAAVFADSLLTKLIAPLTGDGAAALVFWALGILLALWTMRRFVLAYSYSLNSNMLRITSYPVQTIAMMVGFENQQYFYRLFKKFMGITPQEYRRQGASFGQ